MRRRQAPAIVIRLRISFRPFISLRDRDLFLQALISRAAEGICDKTFGIVVPPIKLIVESKKNKNHCDGGFTVGPCEKHTLNHKPCFECVFKYVDLHSEFTGPPPPNKLSPLNSAFIELVWMRLFNRRVHLRRRIEKQALSQT